MSLARWSGVLRGLCVARAGLAAGAVRGVFVHRTYSSAAPGLEETQRRVLAVVRQCAKTDVAGASLSTPWARLGLDSLDVVEVMIALEDEFQVEIPDAVADAAESADVLAQYIHELHAPPGQEPIEQIPTFDSEEARDEYVRKHGPI